jgi:IS30 family transposase
MHQEITVLEVDFYFATLQSVGTWSKWKSKWTYKAIYTQIDLFEEITIERIIEIQEKLNNRPRKRFNFETPNYMFNQKLHL